MSKKFSLCNIQEILEGRKKKDSNEYFDGILKEYPEIAEKSEVK